MNRPRYQKVALVHDFLVAYGGAERVLQVLAEQYPDAPIYTLIQDPAIVRKYFPGRDIRSSFLQRFPLWLRRRYPSLFPFYPVAIETIDLREFDLVLSSSGAWAKGIITRLHTKHVAYLHSPMRYAWEKYETYARETIPRWVPLIVARFLLSYMRLWDRQAAERPDALIANSHYTQARIEKYYRKTSEVVYPPAALFGGVSQGIIPRSDRKHFLIVSRLTKSKKIQPVVEAFNKLGFPLLIVGTGREEKNLRRIAGPNIVFLGALSDEELACRYREARAVILPSEEDFGMVAVESLSCGTPVIAYEYGGIREILRIGETGEVFRSQTPEVIAEAIMRFTEREHDGYPTEVLRESAMKFSREAFAEGIDRVVRRISEREE